MFKLQDFRWSEERTPVERISARWLAPSLLEVLLMLTAASNLVGTLSVDILLGWKTLILSDGGRVVSGDRLISVNGKNLEGLSHTGTVDVLQNTPDDVTLVVSQPVERLYKGKMENLDFFVEIKLWFSEFSFFMFLQNLP